MNLKIGMVTEGEDKAVYGMTKAVNYTHITILSGLSGDAI